MQLLGIYKLHKGKYKFNEVIYVWSHFTGIYTICVYIYACMNDLYLFINIFIWYTYVQ